jgi:hypothetical protein
MVTLSGMQIRSEHKFQSFDGACRVSCVRFSPNVMNPVIVSCGWDKVVKVRFFFQIIPQTLVFGRDVIIYICYFRGL